MQPKSRLRESLTKARSWATWRNLGLGGLSNVVAMPNESVIGVELPWNTLTLVETVSSVPAEMEAVIRKDTSMASLRHGCFPGARLSGVNTSPTVFLGCRIP